jgi:hypothetical protein
MPEVRVIEPDLPKVVHEVAAKLISDDWCRCSTTDGREIYYVIGFAAHVRHVQGQQDFPVSEFPSSATAGLLGEHVARSQLGERRDYLKQSIQELKSAGVSETVIRDFMAANEVTPPVFHWDPSVSADERLRLVGNFITAWFLSTKGPGISYIAETELQEADKEIRTTRQKRALEEIAKKYEKMLSRWEALESLSFVDAQLAEATRCLLYGFTRAAVVVAASALESRLKRIGSIERFDTYDELIRAARRVAGFSAYIEDWAKQVFRKRNDTVHQSWCPDHDGAAEVLCKVRQALTELPTD